MCNYIWKEPCLMKALNLLKTYTALLKLKGNVNVPSVLYYNNFFVTPRKSVSYTLVSIIYCYGFSIDVGHYSCTLFSSNGKCITFDDASITEKTILWWASQY